MDLETENRIAAILLKEAAELRRQSEKQGVDVYLRNHGIRCRPNSRFISATVRGVQQANRAVEISEMWRVRHKELALEDRLKEGSNLQPRSPKRRRGTSLNSRIDYFGESKGFTDEEVDDFLHSREKRGRGGVGSRMDETGPYLVSKSSSSTSKIDRTTSHEHNKWERHSVGRVPTQDVKLMKYNVHLPLPTRSDHKENISSSSSYSKNKIRKCKEHHLK